MRVRLAWLAAALALGTACALHASGLAGSLERSSVDLRFQVLGAQRPPRDVTLVAIDATSLARLGRYPFSRRLYARALRNIAAARPSAIVFDVQFTEPSDDPAADDALIEAAHGAPGTIFATAETDAHGGTRVFGGGSGLAFSRGRPAGARAECDPVCRRVPFAVGGLETMPVAVVERVRGRPLARTALGPEPFWIDYAGPAGTITRLHFADVVAGRLAAASLGGRVVVVGPVDPTLGDQHESPFGGSIAGAEVQANAIETALRGAPLREAGSGIGWLCVALFALAGPLAMLRRRPLLTLALVAVVVLAGYAVAAQLAFDGGTILAFVDPLLALAIGAAAAVAAAYVATALERDRTGRQLLRTRRRVVEVADEERRRVERDLHDGAQQGLLAVGMWVAQLRQRLGSDAEVDALLERVSGGIAEAVGDLRALAQGTYPAVLTDRGLDAALRSLLDRTPAAVTLAGAVGRRLAPEVEATVYFVACEALANAAKHARATRVALSVEYDGSSVVLSVGDDGVGGADVAAGGGLRGLLERVEALGGTLEVVSGSGTRVVATVPVGVDAERRGERGRLFT